MKKEKEPKVVWPEGFHYVPCEVDPTIPDLSNDPVVIAKTERAKETLSKVKFPPDWKTRNRD